ncbi:MAG: SGNH/GDSL hydrolase family protein [Gallintestinimicrobium sp.]
MYQIVYGNAIGYITQTACQPVCVDVAMTAALAAQAEAVKQQVAQAQAAAAALAAQQAALAQQAAMQQAAVQQAALAQAQAEQKAPIPAGSGNVIFVGDSRTGQMANAVGGTAAWPGTAFVACFGGGVDWLSTAQAKKDVDQYMTPGSVIILNYGVNDLSRHNDYITTINRYAQDWISKGATVYFASVGPVGENEYGKRNWAVEYFNNQLNNRLDARIGRLNLYVFLAGSGYTTQADGLHYDGATYAAMTGFDAEHWKNMNKIRTHSASEGACLYRSVYHPPCTEAGSDGKSRVACQSGSGGRVSIFCPQRLSRLL